MRVKALCIIISLACMMSLSQKPDTVNSSTKNYLILVVNEADKQLYQNYIQERVDQYDIKIFSLEEKKISNNPKSIKSFLTELHKTFPFYYAAFDENIALNTIVFEAKNWSKDVRSDNEYVNLDNDPNFIPEFYLGRITRSFLAKQWKKLPQQSVLFALPVLYYDHYVSRCRGYFTRWCDLRFLGIEYKKLLEQEKIKYIEMYENRYSYRQASTKGVIQLNQENFQQTYKNNTLIISTSTYEPLDINIDEITYDYSYHTNLYTATWEDKDKDRWVDFEGKEVAVEEFCDFSELDNEIKQIWILPTLNFPEATNGLYCFVSRYNDIQGSIWYSVDNQGLRYSYASSYKTIIDGLFKGNSISECVFNAFNDNIEKYEYTNSTNLTYFVYGPPETTMNDLVENAKMKILPKEIENSSEITFPINKDEVEFLIKCSGEASLNLRIEFDQDYLDITPSESFIEPGKEQKIILKLKKKTIRSYSSPKPKQTTVTIKSNAGDRKIIVKWKDV